MVAKKNEKKDGDDFVFDAVEGGAELATEDYAGSEGVAWVPHFAELPAGDAKKRAAKMKNGALQAPYISGVIVQSRAFGRDAYFVEAKTASGNVANIQLPDHGTLFSALARVKLGSTIGIRWKGRDPRARPNEPAAHLYDLTVPKSSLLSCDRPGAPRVVFRNR